MATVQRQFQLTGKRKGETVTLGNYRFVDGIVTITATQGDMRKHEQFLRRNWEVEPVSGTPVTEVETKTQNKAQPAQKDKLAKALAQLDADNDEHWTQDGKPAISVVAELSGVSDIKRKDLESLFPEVRRHGTDETTNH